MDRHFDKLSISASGLLGDRRGQPHHYQTQQPQPQLQQQQQLPHHPVRRSQQPTSVYDGFREQSEESPREPARQRTGRVRQSRSSTWGGGDAANGQQLPSAMPAELDETVDLRRRAPSQAESPRTPRTPRTPAGGGSPRYAASGGHDDQHHLAAISPRGAAGASAVPHSYQRRDRHPSSSSGGGGGGLMFTEDDFQHAREGGSNHSSSVQSDAVSGWQPHSRGPEDVSTRLLQKYKTDSVRVEVTDTDRQRQQQQQQPHHPTTGLSKSHEGFIVPRRLPPLGRAKPAAAHQPGEEDSDEDGIECDGGSDVDEDSVEEHRQRKQQQQRRQHHQRRHQEEDQVPHKGRTRTN